MEATHYSIQKKKKKKELLQYTVYVFTVRHNLISNKKKKKDMRPCTVKASK